MVSTGANPIHGNERRVRSYCAPVGHSLSRQTCGPRLVAEAQCERSKGTGVAHCVQEHKNPANVRSGQRSQELTFDFISAEAGTLRRAQTVPGHQCQIEAWGKHIRSESPVELSLGVDLTGGEDWQAASVEWYPWDEAEEETWMRTQVAVS
jgi:hypothetical protein